MVFTRTLANDNWMQIDFYYVGSHVICADHVIMIVLNVSMRDIRLSVSSPNVDLTVQCHMSQIAYVLQPSKWRSGKLCFCY